MDDLTHASDETLETDVATAIERSDYTWRSVDALIRETGQSRSAILKTLADNRGFRLRRNADGTLLVTTRRKYEKDVPSFFKFYSALINRVA